MDFTLKSYRLLLNTLIKQSYQFQTFSEFLEKPLKKVIILRHDVDLLPYNSLTFAKIQHELGVKASYYFRAVPESWNEAVIKDITAMGYEVGYHYENLTTCNGEIEKGIIDFKDNLKKLRKLTDVKTICMHGSPRSKYDSKDLWAKYDYKDYAIIGEPYFDIDFNNVFYLTDTGRRWNGWKVSVRDKVSQQEEWEKESLIFHSTNDIIKAAQGERLPNRIMMTFHPQRWHRHFFPWIKEFVLQNMKNIVKSMIAIKDKNN